MKINEYQQQMYACTYICDYTHYFKLKTDLEKRFEQFSYRVSVR